MTRSILQAAEPLHQLPDPGPDVDLLSEWLSPPVGVTRMRLTILLAGADVLEIVARPAGQALPDPDLEVQGATLNGDTIPGEAWQYLELEVHGDFEYNFRFQTGTDVEHLIVSFSKEGA